MDDVRKEYPTLDETQKQTLSTMKEFGQQFFDFVDALPYCREHSIAKTKIEEAVMWASKGITT